MLRYICIDLTGSISAKQLPKYVESGLIQEDLTSDSIKNLRKNNVEVGNQDNPTSWGNELLYIRRR